MNKKHTLVIVGLLLVLGGGGAAFWALSGDEDSDATAATSSQPEPATNEEQAEAQASATLSSEYLGNYEITESTYGTQTTVTIDEAAGTRTITSNALPNHETGEFPNSGNPNEISAQSTSYEYPLVPNFTGTAVDAHIPGVALNGVKLEPGTAENFTCSSGETYRVEAIQDLTSLGLDFNNAHVQPTGEYHYHGISSMLTEIYDSGNDLVHVGFAADGHMIYYSKSGAYASSYELSTTPRTGSGCTFSLANRTDVEFSTTKDGAITSDWDYVDGLGDLDECNGVTEDGEYVYIMTDEFPYISRCLKGEAVSTGPGGGGAPTSSSSQQMPPRR